MLYSLASKGNSAMGMFYLARCYEHGIGVERDKEVARNLYKAVAKQGHHKGLYRFALICLKNNEVQLGQNYLRQAVISKEREIKRIMKNNSNILYNDNSNINSNILYDNNNINSNINNHKYYNPMLVNNCPYFYHLGMLYMTDHSQLIKDISYAFDVFKKGAGYGCKHCMFMVGEYYEKNIIDYNTKLNNSNNKLNNSNTNTDKLNNTNSNKLNNTNINNKLNNNILNNNNNINNNNVNIAYKYYANAAALNQSDAQIKIGRLLLRNNRHNNNNSNNSNIKYNNSNIKYNDNNDNTNNSNTNLNIAFTYLESAAFSGNSKGMVALADAFYMNTERRDVLQAYWWYRIAETYGEDVQENIKRTEKYIENTKYNGY
ncbi:hypothetical protein EHP00_1969 [Ecytonucleospora hepatopenaei]|uniref:Uncharacterized protein n=1 Tax=Ecytonucleospora hepatopenaei TaxID=646526 RepID=A0A1W0E7I4_9MICR|nr:hypothetical protein EHP00_1969 [Ecytonucleospora hepatopenaei]